jgi:hypothetical protein
VERLTGIQISPETLWGHHEEIAGGPTEDFWNRIPTIARGPTEDLRDRIRTVAGDRPTGFGKRTGLSPRETGQPAGPPPGNTLTRQLPLPIQPYPKCGSGALCQVVPGFSMV